MTAARVRSERGCHPRPPCAGAVDAVEFVRWLADEDNAATEQGPTTAASAPTAAAAAEGVPPAAAEGPRPQPVDTASVVRHTLLAELVARMLNTRGVSSFTD